MTAALKFAFANTENEVYVHTKFHQSTKHPSYLLESINLNNLFIVGHEDLDFQMLRLLQFKNTPKRISIGKTTYSADYEQSPDVWGPELGVLIDFITKFEHKSEFLPQKAINVHVRLGDYTSRTNSKVYRQLGPDYYQKAIRLAMHSTGLNEIEVFSNSVNRAEIAERLGTNDFKLAVQDEDPVLALCRLSKCQALVTANSTFSWWAGRLAEEEGALVISPQRWSYRYQKEPELVRPTWTMV